MRISYPNRNRTLLAGAAAVLVLGASALLSGCGGGGSSSTSTGSSAGFQATVSITGTLVDQLTQMPLVSRTVTVAGTSLSTLTNSSGVFIIADVPVGTQELLITDSLGNTDGSTSVVVFEASDGTDDLGTLAINTSNSPPPPPLVKPGRL